MPEQEKTLTNCITKSCPEIVKEIGQYPVKFHGLYRIFKAFYCRRCKSHFSVAEDNLSKKQYKEMVEELKKKRKRAIPRA